MKNVSGSIRHCKYKSSIEMGDIWKSRSSFAVGFTVTRLSLHFLQWDLFFPEKVIKIGFFAHSMPYIE